MQKHYIAKLDLTLAPLGFGVMRLPINVDGTFPEDVHKLLATAYEQGINYFDTAYPYLGGHSEELIRDALVKNYPRDSFYIADKLPVWECHSHEDMERAFKIQLERLGVEYIDFYLLHGMNRVRWQDMQKVGALDFLEAKRREGRIRKVGFSIHDNKQTLEKMLDAYDWEFALLQINYYDWIAQHAKESYDLLVERDIPCMVMEPIGGGRLAKLPEQAENLLNAENPEASISSWAMRFVASLPNVVVTLSGMSNTEQLNDNLRQFQPFKPLSKHELSVLDKVVEIIKTHSTIPCSGCLYCIDECPSNIDISQIFQRFNDYKQFFNSPRFDIDYFNSTFFPEARRADKCIECRRCNEFCPQKIDIPKELTAIHNEAIGLFIDVDINVLKDDLSNETLLVCFGAGAVGQNTVAVLHQCGIKADYFCDNGQNLWGSEVNGITVISPSQLEELSRTHSVYVLITSSYHKEIKDQLNAMGIQLK